MATMYQVEIAFSGGCLFVVRDPHRRRPTDPASVEVFLVNLVNGGDHHHGPGHPPKHYPLLTYLDTQNWIPDRNPDLRVGLQGERLLGLDLENRDILLVPGDGAPTKFDLKWAANLESGEEPEKPVDEQSWDCLNWVVPGEKVGLKEIEPRLATASLKLPPGKLRSRHVVRNRETPPYKPILWSFIRQDADAVHTQAMAEEIVYTFESRSAEFLIGFKDRSGRLDEEALPVLPLDSRPDNKIQLSITNLPRRAGGARPEHFPMYAGLSPSTLPSDIALPVTGTAQHRNGICPIMIKHEIGG
jgi:hypothetical protein